MRSSLYLYDPAAKEGHAPLVQEALMAGTAVKEMEAEVRRI